MRPADTLPEVFLCRTAIDFRKGIDGLLLPLLRRLTDTLDECDIRHLDETVV